jgi:hypothetical protein
MTADRTIAQVRQAIADSLSGISGLNVYAIYPGLVNPPAAVIRRTHTDYSTEFNGGDSSTFGVSLYLPAADTVSSQLLLDGYLSRAGSSSVIAALGTDSSLGGIVRSLTVDGADEEGLVDLAGVSFLTAHISVLVTHE